MKDYKKSPTSGKEKPPVIGVKKGKDVTNPNQPDKTKPLTGQLEKEDKKGEHIMGMEEDFKDFMKEQARFNKSLGTFVEGLSKKEEVERDDHRIQEQIKAATTPLEKKVKQQGTVLEELQNQLKPFGEVCTTVEECQTKIKELEKAPPEEEAKEKSLDEYSAQEKYDSIKIASTALADLDNIYAGRFAEDPEYRKLALEKLSPETFVELVKNKEIDDKLTGMCQDEACRIDIAKRIKEVEKSTGKKLL